MDRVLSSLFLLGLLGYLEFDPRLALILFEAEVLINQDFFFFEVSREGWLFLLKGT